MPASFSNAKYEEIAPYSWLNPYAKGYDIHKLEVFRSRLPKDVFREIYRDFRKASLQYGRIEYHNNEETRSRYIASVSRTKFPIRLNLTHLQFFSEVVSLFGCAIINDPGGLLDAEFTKKGRIEHHFYSMNSVSIVFIEVEKIHVFGKGRLDVIAQVLAECAGMSDSSLFWLQLQILTTLLIILACDYVNLEHQHWVPILAILCDGEKFEFLVYDSVIKSVYSSEMTTGVLDFPKSNELLAPSLKRGKVANNLPLQY